MNGRLGAILAVAGIALASGCDDRRPKPELEDVADSRPRAPPSWIRRNDEVDPAVWLASKEAGHALPVDDPAVSRARRAFRAAATRFLESDRMVANRTAQLVEMLANDGKTEDATALIEGLASVASASGGKETYGELCQFYFILRHGGADRDSALGRLRGRYGGGEKENETAR
jgi:hypothetical protein